MTHLSEQAIKKSKVLSEPQWINESSFNGATCLIPYFPVWAKRNLEECFPDKFRIYKEVDRWDLDVGSFPGMTVINLVLFCLVLSISW